MKKLLIVLSILLLLAACAPQPVKPAVQVSTPGSNVNVGVMPPRPVQVVTPETSVADVKPSGQTPVIGTENIPAEAKSWAVDIKGFAFNPGTVTIKAGETITWTNSDTAPHTVTDISGPESFKSDPVAPGGSFSHTFTKPGKYTYKCSIHPTMNGVVVVQ